MVPKFAVRFLLLALFLSACGQVEHEAPFDPKSPISKQARGEVAGRATLENEVDHSQIAVVLFNGTRRYEASTDKAGDYLFQNVVPGTYQIIANARYFQERKISVVVPLGERVEAERVMLPSLRAVLTGNALAQVLIDRAFKTEGGVLLKLARSNSIRGAAPMPAFQTMASAATLPAIAFQTVSDGEGNWQIANVPVGHYAITASFENIPPLVLDDVVVAGDGEVQVDPFLLIPLTGFFDIVGKQDGRNSAEYTTTATVELRLTGSGAVQRMKVGHTENKDCVYPASPPVLYQAIYPTDLTAEGMNTVCVRFVAASGEETVDLKQSINYDGTAPIFYRAEFLAKNGYIDTNTAVLELTAADENSGMRTVQYSMYATGATDAPKDLFQTAIVLPVINEGPNTFYLRVGDLAGNYAPQMPVTVTLDTTPPVLDSVTINGGAARTANSNFSLAIAVTDTSTIEMQISESSVFSGAAWIPYQSAASYVASNVNGLKTVYVRTRDPLLRTSNVVSASIIFDTTPPADGAVAFAAPATSNPVVRVYLSATDNLSAWGTLEAYLSGPGLVAVNGVTTAVNTWVNAAAVTEVTFNADGPQTLNVRFRDEVLNETSIASATIVVDTVAPVIDQAQFQSSSGYTLDAVNILRLTASDDRTGLAYYQLADSVTNLTSAPLEAWRDTVFVPIAVQGLNVRWVRAIDAAGNYGSPVTAWVIYDTVPPVLDGVVLNGGAPRTSDNKLRAAIATTDVTIIELQVSESSVFSGAPWIPFASSVSFTASAPNGVKTVYVRGRDSLNQFSNVVTASVIFDTQPPIDLSIAFAGDATSNAATSIYLAASDNLSAWAGIEVQVTGTTLTAVNGAPANVGAWLPASAVTSVTLGGDGFHLVGARFRDEVGNVSSTAWADVVVDSAVPVVQEAAFDSSGGYTSDPIGILRLTASDDRSGLKYLQLADDIPGLDSAPLDPWSGTLFVPLGAPGMNVKYVRAVDTAGNYSAPVSAWVILDTLPPVLDDLTLNGGAQFALSNMLAAATVVSDASVTEMQVSESSVFSGAPWIPYQTPVSYLVSATNGMKTIYARVRDPLGQVSNTIARAITLDTQAPYLAQAVFAKAVTNAASSTLTLTAADNISAAGALQMRIQGAALALVGGSAGNVNAWIPYASAVTVTFTGTGTKTVAVEYRDEAGNTSVPAAASTVIDTTGPVSQVTLLSAEGNNRRAQLGWTAVADAAYYVVQAMRGVSYNGAFTPSEPDQTVAGTSLVFTGLKNNADYTFRVRSYDAVGNADAAYSNLMTAAVGGVQRAVAWPGTTLHIVDFKLHDGVLHAMMSDSSRNMTHMRSVDNGVSWTRTVLETSVFHQTGAMAVSPAGLLTVHFGSSNLEFRYSADAGGTFSSYTLPTFDHVSHSYRPGLALDGNLGVFIGAKKGGPAESVDLYLTTTNNGGANSFGWSTPLAVGPNMHRSVAATAACISGPRMRVVYRVPNGVNRELWTGYSNDAGANWTFEALDTTGSNYDEKFECHIDAQGSTYILYKKWSGASSSYVLWVEQTVLGNENQATATLPALLPNGDTADFANGRMWVNKSGRLYFAAQDQSTDTLWMMDTYLGDGAWDDPDAWNTRRLDAFPSAGDNLGIAGEGRGDFRILYEVGAMSRVRLLTPYLPAPSSFRSMLSNGDDVFSTWNGLSGLNQYTVLTGDNYNNFSDSFDTNFDTVSYPYAGFYNAVASRDAYGPGEPSDIYYNFLPDVATFGSLPPGLPNRAKMGADPYWNDVYLALAVAEQVWFARVDSVTGNVSWSLAATLSTDVDGVDVYASSGNVWITYCNATDGLFVRRSTNRGTSFTAGQPVFSSGMGSIRGSDCAIAGEKWSGVVTLVSDNDNDMWEVFTSTDGGASFAGQELAPYCESSGERAEVVIDVKDPQVQAVMFGDYGMGWCNQTWTTDDHFGGSFGPFNSGGEAAALGIYDGVVFAVEATPTFSTDFMIGSVRGSDWIVSGEIDEGAYAIGGVGIANGQYAMSYLTDSGIELATCSYHCTTAEGWATGTVLPATSTDIPVFAMDAYGSLSFGVFGAGSADVRFGANQGSYTDIPMP